MTMGIPVAAYAHMTDAEVKKLFRVCVVCDNVQHYKQFEKKDAVMNAAGTDIEFWVCVDCATRMRFMQRAEERQAAEQVAIKPRRKRKCSLASRIYKHVCAQESMSRSLEWYYANREAVLAKKKALRASRQPIIDARKIEAHKQAVNRYYKRNKEALKQKRLAKWNALSEEDKQDYREAAIRRTNRWKEEQKEKGL